MTKKKSSLKKHIEYHKDGSVWAKGQKANGVLVGYWEWFRKDGTMMRSGHFENGEQIGEWITYDKKGEVYKVTHFKSKKKKDADATPDTPLAKARTSKFREKRGDR
jgi:antitoxin component YwqK of YwqJK toxin-antitoxin module